MAEINQQIAQATTTTAPDIEEAVELFSNIPMLWNEATTDERKRLLSTLIEEVYIDLKIKHVKAIMPTPVFRSLFGTGINTLPDSPIRLLRPGEDYQDIGGVGGDGGELNSPSKRDRPEYATSLVNHLSHLPFPC